MTLLVIYHLNIQSVIKGQHQINQIMKPFTNKQRACITWQKENKLHTRRHRISQRFAISGFSKICKLICYFCIFSVSTMTPWGLSKSIIWSTNKWVRTKNCNSHGVNYQSTLIWGERTLEATVARPKSTSLWDSKTRWVPLQSEATRFWRGHQANYFYSCDRKIIKKSHTAYMVCLIASHINTHIT